MGFVFQGYIGAFYALGKKNGEVFHFFQAPHIIIRKNTRCVFCFFPIFKRLVNIMTINPCLVVILVLL